MYHANTARRMMAGYLANLYAGIVALTATVRNLHALGAHCQDHGDLEGAEACATLAFRVEDYDFPSLEIEHLEIHVEPPERIDDEGPHGLLLEHDDPDDDDDDDDPDDDEDGDLDDATDAAAELAAEHGIALGDIQGSGEDGRIVKSDVEAAIEAAASEGGSG